MHGVEVFLYSNYFSIQLGGSHYNKGQCGHGHLNDIDQPELVKFFKGKPVQKVSCGGYHTMALLSIKILDVLFYFCY